MSDQKKFDAIVSLCKRRGFVYPGSEIYGGLANTYDFGPLGVELLRNIRNHWWNYFVSSRQDIVGLDTAILMNPKVWEASGHTKSFSDPMAECKECNTRIRVDKELNKIGVNADEKMSEELKKGTITKELISGDSDGQELSVNGEKVKLKLEKI